MAITLAHAEKMLQAWLDAELAVTAGQSYRIGSRQLTRADAKVIAERVRYWERVVAQLSGSGKRGMRVFRIMPRDL